MGLDVLVVAPHPDDAELGMAGGILQLHSAGAKVGILDLTSGEPTPHGTLEVRAAETAAATGTLGISWRENLGLTNRALQADLSSRAKLAEVIRRTRPRWLFAPYWVDAHPDHVAATELVEAARFWSKLTKTELAGAPHHPERIYHYFSIHLKLAIQPDFVLDITPYWEQKLASIACYHSQFIAGREDDRPTLMTRLRDHAAYWGAQIGVEYGEPYACREPIGLTGLQQLR